MRRSRLLPWCFALLALTACAVPGSPAQTATIPSPVSPKGRQDSPLPRPTLEKPGGPLPEGAVILFSRSGGFAGIVEEWTIYADGRIVSATGETAWAQPDRVQEVIRKAESLGFFEMAHDYVPADTCCDRILYELTIRSGERVHTVRVLEPAPDAPRGLWEIIGEVTRLVEGAQG